MIKLLKSLSFSFLKAPFIGKYSISDIFKSVLAFAFIIITVSGLIFYIHMQIEERTQQIAQKSVYIFTDDQNNNPGSIKFSVESIIDFPISQNPKIQTTGYIIKDDTTGVQYIYINTGKCGTGTITKYWDK